MIKNFEFFSASLRVPECLTAGNLDSTVVGRNEIAQEFKAHSARSVFFGGIAFDKSPSQRPNGRPVNIESPIHAFGNGHARIGDGKHESLLVRIKLAASNNSEAGIGVSLCVDEYFPQDLLELQHEIARHVWKPLSEEMKIEVVVKILNVSNSKMLIGNGSSARCFGVRIPEGRKEAVFSKHAQQHRRHINDGNRVGAVPDGGENRSKRRGHVRIES